MSGLSDPGVDCCLLFTRENSEVSMTLRWCWLLLVLVLLRVDALPRPAAYKDNSVKGYLAERSCWGNEICKEEFQTQFRCRCPQWSFCRSPGRYYNAYCSMTGTGYIWVQAYN